MRGWYGLMSMKSKKKILKEIKFRVKINHFSRGGGILIHKGGFPT